MRTMLVSLFFATLLFLFLKWFVWFCKKGSVFGDDSIMIMFMLMWFGLWIIYELGDIKNIKR